jgi:hypothetical protein
VLKAGIWYLAAQVGMGVRTYRLSNILDLEVTDEAFERPADFDLATWWLAATKRFEKELVTDTAQLRVSTAGMKALRDLGSAVSSAAEASASEPDESGWRRVTIPIESIAHAAAQVLRLGAQAEVLKPAALRREVVERIAAVAALYSWRSAAGGAGEVAREARAAAAVLDLGAADDGVQFLGGQLAHGGERLVSRSVLVADEDLVLVGHGNSPGLLVEGRGTPVQPPPPPPFLISGSPLAKPEPPPPLLMMGPPTTARSSSPVSTRMAGEACSLVCCSSRDAECVRFDI